MGTTQITTYLHSSLFVGCNRPSVMRHHLSKRSAHIPAFPDFSQLPQSTCFGIRRTIVVVGAVDSCLKRSNCIQRALKTRSRGIWQVGIGWDEARVSKKVPGSNGGKWIRTDDIPILILELDLSQWAQIWLFQGDRHYCSVSWSAMWRKCDRARIKARLNWWTY